MSSILRSVHISVTLATFPRASHTIILYHTRSYESCYIIFFNQVSPIPVYRPKSSLPFEKRVRGDHPKDPKRRLVGENGSGGLVSAPHRECKREELKLHQASTTTSFQMLRLREALLSNSLYSGIQNPGVNRGSVSVSNRIFDSWNKTKTTLEDTQKN